MMMTRKDNSVNNPLSQSLSKSKKYLFLVERTSNNYYLDYNTYSTFTHDYHHRHNPWEKPTYATFAYQPTPFSIGTLSSTGGPINRSSDSYSSSNLNHTTSSLYRRHSMSRISFV